MRPIKGKTIILDGPPAGDDGDPHFDPARAPAHIAVESFFTLSPSEIRLLDEGGAIRIRQEGAHFEFDVAGADEIDR